MSKGEKIKSPKAKSLADLPGLTFDKNTGDVFLPECAIRDLSALTGDVVSLQQRIVERISDYVEATNLRDSASTPSVVAAHLESTANLSKSLRAAIKLLPEEVAASGYCKTTHLGTTDFLTLLDELNERLKYFEGIMAAVENEIKPGKKGRKPSTLEGRLLADVYAMIEPHSPGKGLAAEIAANLLRSVGVQGMPNETDKRQTGKKASAKAREHKR